MSRIAGDDRSQASMSPSAVRSWSAATRCRRAQRVPARQWSWLKPPSTTEFAPVTKLEPEETRNSAAVPISSRSQPSERDGGSDLLPKLEDMVLKSAVPIEPGLTRQQVLNGE